MRLIDADALDKRRIDYIVDGYAESVNDMTEWGMAIIEAHTIDAVEVVRCKECKHYSIEGETTHFGWCGYWNKPTDEMRYCSDGEREGE